MKRLFVFAVIFVGFAVFTVAYAAAINNDDTWVNRTDPTVNYDTQNLEVVSTGFPSCLPADRVVYIKWDLSAVNGEISSADTTSEMILTVITTLGGDGNLVLYEVPDTPSTPGEWYEETVTYAARPSLGSQIMSIPLPTSTGPVSFESDALNDYFNRESSYVGGGDTTAGDNLATIAIQLEDCTQVVNGVVFGDKESVSPPLLNLFNPTAIKLMSAEASNTNNNLTLWIGFVVLLVVALGTLFIYRRRADSH